MKHYMICQLILNQCHYWKLTFIFHKPNDLNTCYFKNLYEFWELFFKMVKELSLAHSWMIRFIGKSFFMIILLFTTIDILKKKIANPKHGHWTKLSPRPIPFPHVVKPTISNSLMTFKCWWQTSLALVIDQGRSHLMLALIHGLKFCFAIHVHENQ